MFVRWRMNEIAVWGSTRTDCRHNKIGPGDTVRYRIFPVVLHSYRGEGGVSRHDMIWRPRVGINSCCIEDYSARTKFWQALEGHITALGRPPGSSSSGAILLDRLDWLRDQLAAKVRPPTDDEHVTYFEGLLRSKAT